MNFQEAQAYLASLSQPGLTPDDLRLERIRVALGRLGHPEKTYPIIHIAGTNGKGSVSSYLAHIAACAGKKVGWFTSPHLEHFTERIRVIDGRAGLDDFKRNFRSPEIREEAYADQVSRVKFVLDQVAAEGYGRPTIFELLTLVAYTYFCQVGVDLALIEVGVGGRLDATNTIEQPEVSVITALGYDHMKVLGNSLAEIAREKAGIIKPHCPVVLYDPRDIGETSGEGVSALAQVRRKAEAEAAPLSLVSWRDFSRVHHTDRGQAFDYQGESWQIRLRGTYQIMNAGLAIAASRHFADVATIREGLAQTTWPGRLEVLREDPLILIDGAHNVQGVWSFVREIQARYADQPLIYLLGAMADKEYGKELQVLFSDPAQRPYKVCCTEPESSRAEPAADLAQKVAEVLRVAPSEVQPVTDRTLPSMISYAQAWRPALEAALTEANTTRCGLVVLGSLYLIGSVRPIIIDRLKQGK